MDDQRELDSALALIDLALERGYVRMEEVHVTTPPFDPEGAIPDLIAQSDTHPTVYAVRDDNGSILVAPNAAHTDVNKEERLFRSLLKAFYREIPDQYAQTVAFRL
jgi:hypothetical protein